MARIYKYVFHTLICDLARGKPLNPFRVSKP